MWVFSNYIYIYLNSIYKSIIYLFVFNEFVGSFRDIKIYWFFEILILEINYEYYKFEFLFKNKFRVYLKIVKLIYYSNLLYLCIYYGYFF